MDNIEAIAGDNIEKGDLLVVINGVAYQSIREKELELWQHLGYRSEKQCLATIKANIPEIIKRTAKHHDII